MAGKAIRVHSLEQARAAVAAAAALGVPVTLLSAEGAAATVGIAWFKAVVERARAAHPRTGAEAVMDCGDKPGHVLGALRHGFTRVRFAGPTKTRRELEKVAAAHGAALVGGRANALDLLDESDPETACRAWLAPAAERRKGDGTAPFRRWTAPGQAASFRAVFRAPRRVAPPGLQTKFRTCLMKINGNAIRPGNVIEHKNRLWRAIKIQHTQPGKGGAYLQVELKDIRDGTKLNERFRASEDVEKVRLDQKAYQFLFADGDMLTLMDNETYEQIMVNSDLVGEPIAFLQDGMTVTVEGYEGAPISVALPETVVMEITEADAVVKGQTASSSYKPAVLENGVRTLVPPHIESGTRIVVNTADASYVERAKD